MTSVHQRKPYTVNFISLRYLALIFLVVSQLGIYLTLAYYLSVADDAFVNFYNKDYVGLIQTIKEFRMPEPYAIFLEVMRGAGALVPPLYFAATVAYVLNLRRGELAGSTIRNGVIAILLFVVELAILIFAIIVVMALIFGLIGRLADQHAGLVEFLDRVLAELQLTFNGEVFDSSERLIKYAETFAALKITELLLRSAPSFNVFLDMFLCLLMCLAWCTHPKWANTTWKKVLLRCSAIVPIGYILAAFMIRGLHSVGAVNVSLTVLASFPSKKLFQFIFFGIILVNNRWQKGRRLSEEKGLRVVNLPQTDMIGSTFIFESPADTKKRIYSSAVYLGGSLLILCIVDFCFMFTTYGSAWGLGKSWYAVFAIPFFFFFDDKKPVPERRYKSFSRIYFASMCAIAVFYFLFVATA